MTGQLLRTAICCLKENTSSGQTYNFMVGVSYFQTCGIRLASKTTWKNLHGWLIRSHKSAFFVHVYPFFGRLPEFPHSKAGFSIPCAVPKIHRNPAPVEALQGTGAPGAWWWYRTSGWIHPAKNWPLMGFQAPNMCGLLFGQISGFHGFNKKWKRSCQHFPRSNKKKKKTWGTPC